MKKIILASASPRRKQLLKQIGLIFSIEKSSYEEKVNKRTQSPHKLVQKLSLGKAKAVARKHKDAVIIAADTLVFVNGKVVGKPKDLEDAKKILLALSGKIHLVITGFTIIDVEKKKIITRSIETKVYMKALSKEKIDNYVDTKKPLDKAGAYAIQEIENDDFIEKIEGDYYNIVGLPIFELKKELKKIGIKSNKNIELLQHTV